MSHVGKTCPRVKLFNAARTARVSRWRHTILRHTIPTHTLLNLNHPHPSGRHPLTPQAKHICGSVNRGRAVPGRVELSRIECGEIREFHSWISNKFIGQGQRGGGGHFQKGQRRKLLKCAAFPPFCALRVCAAVVFHSLFCFLTSGLRMIMCVICNYDFLWRGFLFVCRELRLI